MYVFFKFIGNSWVEQNPIITGQTAGDQFGRSLSLSANGSILAAGTPFNDDNGTSAGHVRVFENTTLSTVEFENNPISFYPNPVKDFVHFNSNKNIETISIYNLVGQEVLTKLINSDDFSIDISSLSNGTYFVKLNTNNKSQSVKLLNCKLINLK
jgi:hypothetical protein